MMVIDIETVKRVDLPDQLFPSLEDIKAPSNYKDEVKIREYSEKKLKEIESKMSLDPVRNQICSIALLSAKDINDKMPCVLFSVRNDEKGLLDWLKDQLTGLVQADYNLLPMVTFNGMRFDLGMLFAAYIRRDLIVPDVIRQAWLLRYDPSLHVDVYRMLGEEGSLHDWCHSLGIQPPVGKGDMVQGWFDGHDYESIKTHNLSDVWATWEIYRRIMR